MATKTSFWTKVGSKAGDAREWTGAKWKGTKESLLIGGLVAGGAAFMAMRSKSQRATPELAPLPPIPQILTPQDLLASSPVMAQETGPMDGRTADYWQQTVAAQRGGQDQALGNPSQPRMSAIAPENVADLGAMPVRG